MAIDNGSFLFLTDFGRRTVASLIDWWRQMLARNLSTNAMQRRAAYDPSHGTKVNGIDFRSSRSRKRPTFEMKLNDNLYDIAGGIYNDTRLAWLIADLNQGSIKEYWIDGKRIVVLKHRQRITLPTWPDIDIFNKNYPKRARRTKLITIVERTSVDLKALNNAFASVLGTDSGTTVP